MAGSEAAPHEADVAKDVLLKKYDVVLGAPEDWRRRATTAAGLLSAGAAALLGGLLLGPRQDVPSLVRWTSTAAAALYALAVVLFLDVATRPPVSTRYNPETQKMEQVKGPPSMADVPTERFAAMAWAEAYIQVEPLRRRVLVGKWTAVIAMVLTVFSVGALVHAPTPKARVQIASAETLSRLKVTCPKFSEKRLVTLESTSGATVVFTVPASLCVAGKTRVTVPAAEALVSVE